jgi:hypothetical protein
MRWILFAKIVFMFSFAAQAAPTKPAVRLAASTPEGWQQIKTGGETMCARGAEYSFLYRPGDPQKVLVSFGQGGACWDATSCGGNLLFKDTVDSTVEDVAGKGGVYDVENPQNPYYGWTQIVIPYCTADVHLGTGDATYSKGGRSFTIHHRGGINTKAVIAWMQSQYTQVQDLVVSGCSAGSYGSIIWTPTFAEAYKSARVSQYGDSGAGVMDRLFFPQWKIEGSLAKWVPGMDPATIDWDKLTIVDVYRNTANYYSHLQFSEFNHSRDTIQKFFYNMLGGKFGTWTPQMFKIMDDTVAAATNFNYFVADGSEHCSMVNPRMYTESEDGVILADWLRKASLGERLDNVKCTSCSRMAEEEGDTHGPQKIPEEILSGENF